AGSSLHHLSHYHLNMLITPSMTLATQLGFYLPVLLLLGMAIAFVIANVGLSLVIGPVLRGERKATAYESGMTPVGTARKRFNVRFYIIAMTFLVFDVEIIFLYPWAVSYAGIDPASPEGQIFLARVMFFLLTTVVAYIYGYRKGIFRFD
ncbi:MAG: NADH-quinone oxidoreductase subunit A, partial [Planctomycetota bacterium]